MGSLFEVDGTTGVVRFRQKGTSLFVTETGAADPVVPTPIVGQIFYNTTTSTFKIYNGTIWAGTGASASGVSGSVQFSNGTSLASDGTNFFWDDTNNRLGLGTNAPSQPLTILSTSVLGGILITSPAATNSGGITITTGSSGSPIGGSLNLTSAGGGAGGSVLLTSSATGATGNISIIGSTNAGAQATGDITLKASGIGGDPGGGNITLTSAAVGGSTPTAGSLTLTNAGTGGGGDVTLTASTSTNGGNINLFGVGAARGVINTKNFMDYTAVVTPPAVSASGHGRIYFDNTANSFLISQNGGPYTTIGSGGGGGGLENFAVVVGTPSGPYTGSTTVFDLPFSYVLASGDLLVFSSGLLMGIGASNDYLETNTTRVTFNSARTVGEIVRFVYDPSGVAFQIGAIAAKITTYVMVFTDHTILANASGGAFAVTLPSVSTTVGYEFVIKKTDSSANIVTVTPASGTIDGAASFALTTQYQSITVQSDGTNWWLI